MSTIQLPHFIKSAKRLLTVQRLTAVFWVNIVAQISKIPHPKSYFLILIPFRNDALPDAVLFAHWPIGRSVSPVRGEQLQEEFHPELPQFRRRRPHRGILAVDVSLRQRLLLLEGGCDL